MIRQPKRFGRRGAASAPADPTTDTGLDTAVEPDAAVIDPADPAPGAAIEVVPRAGFWRSFAGSGFADWLGLLAVLALAPILAAGSYPAGVFAVAAVVVLRTLPALALPGGLAQALERRWVLVVADLLQAMLFVSIALLDSVVWLFAAVLLSALLAQAGVPARDALLPGPVLRRAPDDGLRAGLASAYLTAVPTAVAFAVLAWVNHALRGTVPRFATHPLDLVLAMTALAFGVSAVVVARVKPTAGVRVREGTALTTFVNGWVYLGASRPVRLVVLWMLAAYGVTGLVAGLAAIHAADLHAHLTGYAVLVGALFAGFGAGVWAGPRTLPAFSRRRLFGLALPVAGLLLLALALTGDRVLAAVLVLGLGLVTGVAWVSGYGVLGLAADEEVRGRTFAFLRVAAPVAFAASALVGAVIAALVGRHTLAYGRVGVVPSGPAWAFLATGLLLAVAGLVAFRALDDKPGTKLVPDLRRAWSGRRGGALPPLPRPKQGLFVAFEGGDGTGKSTQARLLAEWLRRDQDHEVVLTREPGATPLGERLREVLLGHGTEATARAEALLFAADRAHHVETVIRPALARRAIVVTDRFIDSSVAYQGSGRELDGDEVARISAWATQDLQPDLTVVLDLPVDWGQRRRQRDAERASGGGDRLESLPSEFHERVRARFLELARREPHRYLVLDAGASVEELQAAVRTRLRPMLPVSAARRDRLTARLDAEDSSRSRRAAAEVEVLRMDAQLRAKKAYESQAREDALRRAREEAEQQLLEEATLAGTSGAGTPEPAEGVAPVVVTQPFVPEPAPQAPPSTPPPPPSPADTGETPLRRRAGRHSAAGSPPAEPAAPSATQVIDLNAAEAAMAAPVGAAAVPVVAAAPAASATEVLPRTARRPGRLFGRKAPEPEPAAEPRKPPVMEAVTTKYPTTGSIPIIKEPIRDPGADVPVRDYLPESYRGRSYPAGRRPGPPAGVEEHEPERARSSTGTPAAGVTGPQNVFGIEVEQR